MTVDQRSRTGIIDWRSFSIGKSNNVVFHNGSGATLNIVKGNNLSRIAGDLHATGSVYLINREGVVMTGAGHIVTQGSFGASSRNGDADSFGGNGRHLELTASGKGHIVNRGTIDAGHHVSLASRTVNNSGTISAHGADLIAGRRITVDGEVHARGRVETSGSSVRFAGGTIVASHWLVDPTNLTVDSSAANSINKSLGRGTNVTLKTKASGASGPGNKSNGPGDIVIDAALSWSTGAKLTLDAYHGISIDAGVNVKGTGGLVLLTNDGGKKGNLSFDGGHINFRKLNALLSIDGATYTLVGNLATLAGDIAHKPSGNYALAGNYNASADGTYNAAVVTNSFKGTFDGLGNTISGLKISSSTGSAALFDDIAKPGTVADVALTGVSVKGKVFLMHVGALAADNEGTVRNVSVAGMVSGAGDNMGGLVGINQPSGTITSSSSAASVTDNNADAFTVGIGGLAGVNHGLIISSFATKNVKETANAQMMAGGLVGFNDAGRIKSSRASGDVTSNGDYDEVGGLAGYSGYDNGSVIDSSHATGDVTGNGYYANVGGLAGTLNSDGVISNSYATGSATGNGQYAFVGGLVGSVDSGASISNSQASGAVTGGPDSYDGGLVGSNSGTISGCSASGPVSGGSGSSTGPIVGYNLGTVNC